jgi:hypothetical protein
VSAFADWIKNFREQHERARRGTLKPEEEPGYHAAREELARAMLAAQRLNLKPGEKPRHKLRVARALQLDMEFEGSSHRSVTLDVSVGGISTVLAGSPGLGNTVKATLRLPATGPLPCRLRITDVKPQDGSVRIAASFVDLPAADMERLEFFIVDAVLAMFSS